MMTQKEIEETDDLYCMKQTNVCIDKELELFERWYENKFNCKPNMLQGNILFPFSAWKARAALLPSESELYELLAKTSMQFEKEQATLGTYFTVLAQAIRKLLEEPK